MSGTSEGSKRGWDTRRANEAKRQKKSDAAKRGWDTRRRNRKYKPTHIKYRVLTLSDELNEYLSASYRDIQKTILRDSAALYNLYDFISNELEDMFDMISGGVSERWDDNYMNPVGQRRTFEFEMWRGDHIAYEILYYGGAMHVYQMPEDFNLDSLLNLIKSVGVWE